MVQRVCLVSGGTGGHLMPALVLARALRDRGHEPVLFTEGREVERELLKRELPDVQEVDLLGGKPSRLGMPLWVARATMAARRLLRERSVGCVVSTGGRPSLPVGLAARSLGLPLFLLEQNAVTGRANRWLLPFARRIYHGLPSTQSVQGRSLFTGTPLRPEFSHIDRAQARESIGLAANVPVVLVTGGSQGASVLNDKVPLALLRMPFPVQVMHLSGLMRDEAVRRLYAATDGRLQAQVRPVALDMDRMFGAADLVICRGGGSTVAELAASGRPAVIVPYPHHRDRQQLRNAQVLESAGAAIIVEECDLTVDGLALLTEQLLRDPERLRAMGAAALRTAAGDPTGAILGDMEKYAGWSPGAVISGTAISGSGISGSVLPGSVDGTRPGTNEAVGVAR